MNQECIQTKDLQIAYENEIIIPKLNLNIPRGKVTMVIGSNGCGKSTLLKAMSRIIPCRHGEILLHGKSLRRQASKSIARKMAVLPQSPAVPTGLMVKELVAYGRFPYQRPMSGLNEHDLEMIDWAMRSTGVHDLREKMVESLSGGQRQRAWIAMALAQETEILSSFTMTAPSCREVFGIKLLIKSSPDTFASKGIPVEIYSCKVRLP